MGSQAIERVPIEVWSRILSHAQATPPDLLALCDELMRPRPADKPSHSLSRLGAAALDDALMAPYVGRKQKQQRDAAALTPDFAPGFLLRQFAERLETKDKETRTLIVTAYRQELPFPKARYKDPDVLRALFVHDKQAWKKVDIHFKPESDLCWHAARFQVQGTWNQASRRLQNSRLFARICFSFDLQADLKAARFKHRDDEQIVRSQALLNPLSILHASPRRRACKELRREVAEASVAAFCEILFPGRTEMPQELRGLSMHIFAQLQEQGEGQGSL